MSLYDDLGVHKNSDRETIKRAYRKKAQKLHPDRGGDKDKFHAVQVAYDVLYDDARRAYYDAHGADGKQDKQGDLVRRLAALFMQLVESNDVEHSNIVFLMKQALMNGKQNTNNSIYKEEGRIKKYEVAKKRLKKKSSGDNMFVQMLDGQIGIVKRGIEFGKSEIEIVDSMLKVLEDYDYSADIIHGSTLQSLAQMTWGDLQSGR